MLRVMGPERVLAVLPLNLQVNRIVAMSKL